MSRKMNRYLRVIVASLLLACGTTTPLRGQGTQGSISGRVTDSSGGVMVGASITLTNQATNQARTVETNSAGYYMFPNLFPGTYTLAAVAQGFETFRITGITLQVAQQVSENIALQVGQTATHVEVKASTPLLGTQSASTDQVINNTEVLNLPLNGRDFLNLALLTPGASENPGAQSQFSINGQRGNETSMLWGGGDTRSTINGRPTFVPSVDALQEFKIQENSFSAVYGYGTAIINAAFKSGTNQFHGDAWDFLRNSALDARSFFDKTVPAIRRNQFGATAGGPIRKDKTFFFVDYEGLRTSVPQTEFALIPTPAELGGDFTGDPKIYDPLNVNSSGVRQQFQYNGQLNVIPPDRVKAGYGPVGAGLYPATNLTGVKGSNYVAVVPNPESADQYTIKIDEKVSEKDSFFAQFSRSTDNRFVGSPLPLSGTPYVDNGVQFVANETHIFSPNFISNTVLAYTYGWYDQTFQIAPRPISITDFGFQNLSIPPAFWGMPELDITGLYSMGSARYSPFGGWENNYQASENLTYIHGKSQFQFGGEDRQFRPTIYDSALPNGEMAFNGQFTNLPGTSGTGDPVADFVLGYPNSVDITQLIHSNGVVTLRWSRWSLYGQESYKATPKLTLNIGARFERQTSPTEKYHTAYVWDVQTSSFLIPGQTTPHLINPANTFAPRAGIAYQLTPHTVIRAGAGVFDGFIRGLEMGSDYHLVPPFDDRSTLAANPTVPNLLPGTLFPVATGAVTPISAVFAVNQNFPPNYTYEWNFNVQRELAANLMLQVAYVGSSSHGLTGRDLPNQARVDVNPAVPTPIQGRRPYPGVGDESIASPLDNANYNALEVTLEKHYSHGLSLLAAYTHERALGIAEAGDQSAIGDEYTPRHRYYGPLPYDQEHRMTFAYTYDLPIGAGKLIGKSMSGPMNTAVGGWKFTGIGTFFTGEAASVTSNISANVGRADRNYPNCVGNPILSGSQRTRLDWFNTSAFVGQQFGTFGNCGAGIVRVPGLADWDGGLMKDFAIKERYKVEFRAEFFNALNHPSFGTPGLTLGSSSFAVINSTREAGREIQLALKLYW